MAADLEPDVLVIDAQKVHACLAQFATQPFKRLIRGLGAGSKAGRPITPVTALRSQRRVRAAMQASAFHSGGRESWGCTCSASPLPRRAAATPSA